MVTYTQLMGSSEVEVARPILAEVAATIADVQVRNRGTIGGNVCVSDPTNHFPPLLVALDATFTIRGQDGERTVPADEFFLGVYMTAVGEGELLDEGRRSALERRRRRLRGSHDRRARHVHRQRGGDGLGRRRADRDRLCRRDSCACDRDGGAAAGGDFSEDAVRAAAKGLGASLDPPSDVHGSADYRRHLAEVSAVRAVLQAAGRRKTSAPRPSRAARSRWRSTASRSSTRSRRVGSSSTSSATTSGSPARTSAATRATAAPARCT